MESEEIKTMESSLISSNLFDISGSNSEEL